MAYVKAWINFKTFLPGDLDLEIGPPAEDKIIDYFKHLRMEKQMASSSIWTIYSYINSIFKRKYGLQLQTMPRITLTIKGFEGDIKQKAEVFDEDVSKIIPFILTFYEYEYKKEKKKVSN